MEKKKRTTKKSGSGLFDTREEYEAWERGAKERARHLRELAARGLSPEQRRRFGYPDPG
jgi:hypothetical protein